jgi:hypothetical protein
MKVESMTNTQRKRLLIKVSHTLKRRDKTMTDVNQEKNVEVTRDDKGFIVETDTLTFTTPKNTTMEGATPGEEKELSFTYRQVDSDELANAILEEKKWSIQELVNRKLSADARSARYQSELVKHKPITVNVSVDDIKTRMARDFQRIYASMGKNLSDEAALKMVEAQLSENNG